jgi:hypothetical protein
MYIPLLTELNHELSLMAINISPLCGFLKLLS